MERCRLGFDTCLRCGELVAREKVHCVVPMHKSNLVVISPNERDLLKGISNKGGGSDAVSFEDAMDALDRQHAAIVARRNAGGGTGYLGIKQRYDSPSSVPATTSIPTPKRAFTPISSKVLKVVRPKYNKDKLRARIHELLLEGMNDADATRKVLQEVDDGLI